VFGIKWQEHFLMFNHFVNQSVSSWVVIYKQNN